MRGFVNRFGQTHQVPLAHTRQCVGRHRHAAALEALLHQVPVGAAGEGHAGKGVGDAEQLVERSADCTLARAAGEHECARDVKKQQTRDHATDS